MWSNFLFKLFFLFIYSVNVLEADRILAVFPTQMKSHFLVGQHLLKELAKSGHEVTVISPFKIKDPPKTYHEITTTIPNEAYEAYVSMVSNEANIGLGVLSKFSQWGIDVTNATLSNSGVQNLLNTKQKFDVMLYEIFINDALLGIAHQLKIPVIGISTVGLSPMVAYYTGSSIPNSYVPNMLLGLPEEMNFKERLINTLGNLYFEFIFRYFFTRTNDELYENFFPNPKPSLEAVRKSIVTMVLANSHISLNGPRPFMSNVVEVGGIHIDTNIKTLPEDLKSFLDSAEEGVVYFCMGSNISPSEMIPEKRNAIIKGLSSIKQKVIWKWDHETAKEVDQYKFYSSNWLPQNEILAHKNVKLFITHGGLLGTTESVYHGVPIIGIPMFADQKMNMVHYQSAGLGLVLEFSNLTETNFKYVLNEVLNNEKYLMKAKEMSLRFSDRPASAIETAKFWIEYVVRYNGAKFMQSPALKLNDIEYFNIDVYCFLILFISMILYISYKMLQIILCRTLLKSKSKVD
uniref:UDP-glucuronosyltransferase n=1 Tax=Culicoides sonorensis TaxID=179676 RepID=A0A336K257_CULSO